MMPSPESAKYDEFGRPLHPLAAAIHHASLNVAPGGSAAPVQAPINPPQLAQTLPASVAQAPTSAVAPVDISPAPAMPAEQGIKDLHAPQHDDPQYKNSKLRTVLNAIAGGFAGAAGHPEIGRELRDGKYNRGMQDYKAKLGQLQGSSEVEQQQVNRSEKKASLETTRLGATNKAESAAETNKIKEEAQETARKREQDYKANIDSLTKHRNELIQKETDFQRVLDAKTPEERDSAISVYNRLHPKESEVDKTKAAVEKQEALNASTVKDPNAAKAAQIKAAATSTGHAVGEGTPSALDAEKNRAAAVAEGGAVGHGTDAAIKATAELTRAKSNATLTANVKDTSHAAQIALQAFPDIFKQAESASDTLFANRWKNFRTKTLGTEDSAQYAALSENVAMLQKLVAKVHVGARGTSSILQRFENMFSVDKMDKKTFLDSVKEVRKWLVRYSKLPNIKGELDLSDIDKQVSSGASGEFGTIEVIK